MNTRIDHVANAIKALNGITAEMRTDVAMVVVQGAQVNATLALVEQQRIANLIQLMHIPVGDLSEEIKSALHAAFHDDRDWEAELRGGVIET